MSKGISEFIIFIRGFVVGLPPHVLDPHYALSNPCCTSSGPRRAKAQALIVKGHFEKHNSRLTSIKITFGGCPTPLKDLRQVLWARTARGGGACGVQGQTILHAVNFHNFKSQNFKLSVSNPKSKYVAYLSVLSQISNCQGLGRKNKHNILKTDRRVGILK